MFKELQDNQGLFPGRLLPASEPIRNGLAGCPQQLGYFGSASVGAWFITPRFQLFEKFSGLWRHVSMIVQYYFTQSTCMM